MNTSEAKRVLETALICAPAPLPLADLRALFAGEVGNDSLRRMLDELVNDWQGRGVELVALASGWRFQTIGYREAPGRPALYATTRQFLDDLGLASLDQLPSIDAQPDALRNLEALNALPEEPSLLDDGQASLLLDAEPPPAVDASAASADAAPSDPEEPAAAPDEAGTVSLLPPTDAPA